MEEGSVWKRMADLARLLQETHGDSEGTLVSAVTVTQRSVDSCDAVGLSLVRGRRPAETVAATDDVARIADQLQHELAEGPYIDVMWAHAVVRSGDLAHDQRWPSWGPRVARATGARSIMSFRLFTTADRMGALTLYSHIPDAFDDLAMAEGMVIASQISVALATAEELDSVSQGLAGRTVIGQATGILMERYDLDPVQAFNLLTRLSNENNIKLRLLAAVVVADRPEALEDR